MKILNFLFFLVKKLPQFVSLNFKLHNQYCYLKGHRCYNFQTADVQEIPGMGLNPGPAQAESIQQAYISKNLRFNNQNDQQEITEAVNGIKRASFEMAQSAGKNQKKTRTELASKGLGHKNRSGYFSRL